ncbi:MAG: acetoin utilization protein AcuC [bacterium]
MRKVYYCYTDEYSKVSFGEEHPFKPYRLILAYELSKAYNLFEDVNIEKPEMCPLSELEKVHDKHYLYVLNKCNNGKEMPEAFFYNLGTADNPIFEGMYDWSSRVCGASLNGAKKLCEKSADIYFNIAGGMHHAMPEKASGFCYLNDAAVAINYLLDCGKKVAYIDIDAHHGDGVQKIFYSTSKVLTISLHESGRFLFPGTGFEYEMGEGEGEGFAVNIPMFPAADDENYLRAFFEIVPPLLNAFQPDVIVTQLGVDSLYNDPLATLNLTTCAFERIVAYFYSLNLPWLALGGGGYNVANVARAWTLAVAIMTEREIKDPIPATVLPIFERFKVKLNSLRDDVVVKDESLQERINRETSRVIEKLKKHLFPYHHLY